MSATADKNNKNSSLKEIKEGNATIMIDSREAFYNPVQSFNRDMSVAVIKQFIKNCENDVHVNDKAKSSKNLANAIKNGFSIFEGLSATGLRSIRYALELSQIKEVIANDYSSDAVKCIERNIERNQVGVLVRPHCSDARVIMYEKSNTLDDQFQVVDIDPYGSPSIFLDSAVQAVCDGGLLCVTCTDMAVLCGNHSGTCFAKYGSVSLKGQHCHEMALRIALASIESHANRYSKYIVPLLSISVDYYIRLFVRIFHGRTEVNKSASKKSLVFQCNVCDSFYLQPFGNSIGVQHNQHFQPAKFSLENHKCAECNTKMRIGGPIWSEPIHDFEFVRDLLKAISAKESLYGTSKRMIGLLSVISEELPDQPLYYVPDSLANTVHCVCLPMLKMRSALLKLGHKVSSCHTHKNGIKTNASNRVIWDIMRCWMKENPVNKKKVRGAAITIIDKEPSIEAAFDVLPGANPTSRRLGLVRYQVNPQPNWGPKSRAKRRKYDIEDTDATGSNET